VVQRGPYAALAAQDGPLRRMLEREQEPVRAGAEGMRPVEAASVRA
jgi:ATP-binding cassette subfamily C protein CydCD